MRAYSVGLARPPLHALSEDKPLGRVELRIACLDDRIYPLLTRYMLDEARGAGIRLGGAPFEIARLLVTSESGHPWACYSTVDDLMRAASPLERTVRFKFSSPVVFSRGDCDEPLPLPELVFNSLAKRWNAACSEKFQVPENEFLEVVKRHVATISFNLRSASITLGRDRAQNLELIQTGAVGEVAYRVVGKVPDVFVYLINLLADAAIFTGVGKKTTPG